jgi:26S proteasome regulatory subunit N7
VYEGLYFLAVRDFKKAADLFLDSTATFTATELFSYKTFIFYTVLTSLITLKRVDLKAKVRGVSASCALYSFCSVLVLTPDCMSF